MKTENFKTVKAKILHGVGGLYNAVTEEGQCVKCKPRGNFRHYDISPYPGDNVSLRLKDGETPMIAEILPRKNFIKRPPVANIDKLFITVAAADPEPAYIVVDKLICAAEFYSITPVLIVTKSDLDAVKAEEIRKTYLSCGFDVFVTSSVSGSGVEAVKQFIYAQAEGNVVAFAGESGVGKSSLMNAMFSDLSLQTGETSRIHRGKHTTRAVSLYPLDETPAYDGAYIADTPGFGVFEPTQIPEFTRDDLIYCFRELVPYLATCRYTKCTHLREEGCSIIEAVESGELPRSRHESYVTLYEELKNKRYPK
ncbi:MAG: ribosome small subunit-dependent GTPase A [Clostridia bacterium]|nr:ribosome small subunit-dependent GTPase A [Clostridia bacterium]